MDPISIARNIIKTIELIHSIVETVKENKKQCQLLADEVQMVQYAIEPIIKNPEICERREIKKPLEKMQVCINNCYQHLTKYTDKDRMMRVFQYRSDSLKFKELFEELDQCSTRLNNCGVMMMLARNETREKQAELTDLVNLNQKKDLIIAENRKDFEIMKKTASGRATTEAEAKNIEQQMDQEFLNKQNEFQKQLEDRIKQLETDSGKKLRENITVNQVDYTSLEFDERIGKGGFGEVWKAQWNGMVVAVKRLIVDSSSQQSQQMILSEASLMSKLMHPNIIRLFGIAQNPGGGDLAIILPFMENGSMFDFFRNNPDIDWKVRWRWASEIANGMSYMHHNAKPPVYHRDLKSLNVLLDNNLICYITDFGMSRSSTTTAASNKIGSLDWAAPELFEDAGFRPACDVYSYGIILWEIAANTGDRPYGNMNQAQVIRRVQSGGRPTMPPGVDSTFASFITSCWAQKSQDRPSFMDISAKLRLVLQAANSPTKATLSPQASFTEPAPAAPAAKTTIAHKRLENPEACVFWISHVGPSTTSVSWEVFLAALVKAFPNLDLESKKDAVRYVFDNNQDGKVTMVEVNDVTKGKGLSAILNRLPSLAERTIKNEKAREFWTKKFDEDSDEWHWDDFQDCLQSEFTDLAEIPTEQIKAAFKMPLESDMLTMKMWDQAFKSLKMDMETLVRNIISPPAVSADSNSMSPSASMGMTKSALVDSSNMRDSPLNSLAKSAYNGAQMPPELTIPMSMNVNQLSLSASFNHPTSSLFASLLNQDAPDIQKPFEYYSKLAEQGNKLAQYQVGCIHEMGTNGVAQNVEKSVAWFMKSASLGHAPSQIKLALSYRDGKGVGKNSIESAKWFEKAAEQGIPSAQSYIGTLYENGTGVTVDYKVASKWYEKAASQGSAYSQSRLGFLYRVGRGVTKDMKQALKWYQKAADQNDAPALYNVGLMYEQGNGLPQDYSLALNSYAKAASQTRDNASLDYQAAPILYEKAIAAAQTRLGVFYRDGKATRVNLNEAVQLFHKAAQLGDPSAQSNLGHLCENGIGTSVDYPLAVKWYEKAAVQNVAFAQSRLGFLYRVGRGVTKDIHEAAKWYQKAADLGDVPALYNMGMLHEQGNGATLDVNLAFQYYSKAAHCPKDKLSADAQANSSLHEKAIAAAQTRLGMFYRDGKSVNVDYAQAAQWFQKAADAGDATAQSCIAAFYENGTGVTQNYSQAVHWYEKAAEQNNSFSQVRLGLLYRDGQGIQQNFASALKLFQKAAEQQYAPAFACLGDMYRDGLGVLVDTQKATHYYQKGVELGDGYSRKNLDDLKDNRPPTLTKVPLVWSQSYSANGETPLHSRGPSSNVESPLANSFNGSFPMPQPNSPTRMTNFNVESPVSTSPRISEVKGTKSLTKRMSSILGREKTK